MYVIIRRLSPLWDDEGAGVVWLSLSVAITFALGFVLQLLGLRLLSDGDYATFVLALGIGNVAAAIAAALQPVIAARSASDGGRFLPLAAPHALAGIALACAVAAVALTPTVGPLIALLVVAQIPLHALVGVGIGRLQAGRSFRRMAVSSALWSLARLLVVLLMVAGRSDGPLTFVLALPVALAVEVALLWALGAYRGVHWEAAARGNQLLQTYLMWGLFAWLLNADAVYSRVLLAPDDAQSYAVALTLGRQPLYLVAPLAMVLLPVTLARRGGDQRRRMFAILMTAAILLAGTWLVLGVRPEILVGLLTGNEQHADVALIRGYALVGPLTAAATLELTFTFALGRRLPLGGLVLLAVGSGAVAFMFVTTPLQLLAVQGAVVAVLAVGLAVIGFKASAGTERAQMPVAVARGSSEAPAPREVLRTPS